MKNTGNTCTGNGRNSSLKFSEEKKKKKREVEKKKWSRKKKKKKQNVKSTLFFQGEKLYVYSFPLFVLPASCWGVFPPPL